MKRGRPPSKVTSEESFRRQAIQAFGLWTRFHLKTASRRHKATYGRSFEEMRDLEPKSHVDAFDSGFAFGFEEGMKHSEGRVLPSFINHMIGDKALVQIERAVELIETLLVYQRRGNVQGSKLCQNELKDIPNDTVRKARQRVLRPSRKNAKVPESDIMKLMIAVKELDGVPFIKEVALCLEWEEKYVLSVYEKARQEKKGIKLVTNVAGKEPFFSVT